MPETKHLCNRTLVFCRLDAFEERILLSEDSGFNTHPSGSGLFGVEFPRSYRASLCWELDGR
jgi:hypothetical protein